MKLSLEKLLQRAVGRGTQIAAATPVRDGRVPTSIRLKPETKHFLEAQAQALNTSIQSLVDTILDGVAEASTDDPTARLRSIRERFFLLMEAHGLDLPSAVDLMAPFGFTLSALNSEERLLDLMTAAPLTFLAKTFHVSEKWLRGESDAVIQYNGGVRWYKWIPATAKLLVEHLQAGEKPQLVFLRRRGADFERAYDDKKESAAQREPIGVVMRMARTTPSGTQFTTYQVWEFESWNYAPCRQDLKLLLAFCEQMRIFTVGHDLPEAEIDRLVHGAQLPASLLDRLGSVSWYPDDYAGFQYKISREAAEWPSVADRYKNSSLPQIAVESGAEPLPTKPWLPGEPL